MAETQERDAASVPRRVLYGRTLGRPLRPGRRKALETGLRERALAGVSPDENPGRDLLAAAFLTGTATDCWLEIGFGTGEHLLATARTHPDIALIGAEPYVSGVAAFLSRLVPGEVPHLRIHPGDARDLLEVIPDAMIGRVFLLYPDPWPKRRHAKRRFLHPDNLDALARVMRPGAELRFATDVAAYTRHALRGVLGHPEFVWISERPTDWREAWPGWPGTRYEQKALAEGRRPVYLTFVRSGETGS